MSIAQQRKTLYLLAAMQFAHIMDFMVMMPLAPQLMRVMHISQPQFALLVSIYSFSAAFAGIAVARWSDRYPRKRMLLVMFAAFTLATLFCGLAQSYPLLLLARALAGLSGGVVGGIVQAYVADMLPPERRGWGMGIIMTAFSMSAVAGVPLGIWMGAEFGWQSPFLFLAAISVFIGMLACHYLQPVQHTPSDGSGLLAIVRDRRFWYPFALTLCLMMAGFSVIPHISPYLVGNLGFSEREIAYFYLGGGAATLFTAPVIGRLADRVGKFPAFAGVAALSTVPILLLTHLPVVPLWMGVLVMTFFMVCVSGRFIPAMALTSMVIPPDRRGRFMSINVSVQQLGSGLAALVSGLMLGHDAAGRLVHYERVGYLAAGATLLAIALAWNIECQRRRSGVSH